MSRSFPEEQADRFLAAAHEHPAVRAAQWKAGGDAFCSPSKIEAAEQSAAAVELLQESRVDAGKAGDAIKKAGLRER